MIAGSVTVDISLSDSSRGSVSPSQLKFDSANWWQQQSIALNLAQAALTTAGSSAFSIDFFFDSQIESLHGQEFKAWVRHPLQSFATACLHFCYLYPFFAFGEASP